MLRATLGTIIKRARTQALILAAAGLSIVLATALLAAGPIYADAVYLAGAKRSLQDAPAGDALIEASASLRGAEYIDVDARVTAAFNETVADVGGTIARSAISESYALPGQEEVSELGAFAFSDGLDQHADLIAGQWPQPGETPGVVEAVISSATAETLGLAVGDQIAMQNRRDEGTVQVTISGIFSVRDPFERFWNSDQLWTEGRRPGESYTLNGPFVVARETFLRDLTARPVVMTWRLFPEFGQITVANMPGLRGETQSLPGRVGGGDAEVTIKTGLPALIAGIERSLLATRTSVLILLVQLALLAGYTLILTAGLLVDQRAGETMLMRSRGADVRQLLGISLIEGLLLVVPAVVVGPVVAALGLRLLNHAGPLAAVGLTLEPHVSAQAYVMSAAAGLVCLVMLTIPALLSSHAALRASSSSGRQALRAIWQRGGLDIAVAVLAALGFLQLRRYERPVTQTLDGQLSIDPLLVIAPTLGLLAGATLALRLIPRLARLLERAARNGPRLTPALGAWHLARRPQRYGRSALLLILAVGIGLFAVAYTRTWEQSQGDQAGFQIGADVSLLPSQRQGSIQPIYLPSAYRQLAGAEKVMPFDVDLAQVSNATGSAGVVLLDSDAAPGIVDFRPDLAHEDFATLMASLTAGRPDLGGIELPGEPARLAFELSAAIQQPCEEGEIPGDEPYPCIAPLEGNVQFHDARPVGIGVYALVRDGDGGIFRLPFGQLELDGVSHRYVLPLTTTADDGTVLTPVYPLTVVGLDAVTQTDVFIHYGGLTLLSIATSESAAGEDWSGVPVELDGGWSLAVSTVPTGIGESTFSQITAGGGLVSIEIQTGTSFLEATLPVIMRMFASPEREPAPIPVLVSEHLLEANALSVGDIFKLRLAATEWDVQVVGSVLTFPTMEADDPLIVVADIETLLAMQMLDPSGRLLEPEQRWLAVDDGEVDAALDVLRSPTFASTGIHSRLLRSQVLRNDPVTLGTVGALLIGFLAATIFAIVGFIVSMAVSAHERLREFALLRALGLSSRQLGGWLLLENGFLVFTSMVAGTVLGFVLARSLLPLVSLTAAATAVFPGVIVIIPWLPIGLMQLALLLTLAIAGITLVVALRRRGLGEALRIGDG